MNRVLLLIILAGTGWVTSARAEWLNITNDLGEADVQALAVHPREPKTLYVASTRRVYRSVDAGEHWKQVLGIRGSDNRIHHVYLHPQDPRKIYVASEKGVQASSNGGKAWETVYRGVGEKAKRVQWLHVREQEPTVLWLATAEGVVRLALETKTAQKVTALPQAVFFSIVSDSADKAALWIAGEKGVYRSQDNGVTWQRVLVETRSGDTGLGEQALSQFQIEELPLPVGAAHLIRMPEKDRLIAATGGNLYLGQKAGSDWITFASGELPDKKVNSMEKGSQGFFVATDKGVFHREVEKSGMREISEGLGSREVRALAYHALSQDLYAATKKGVYRYPKPEFVPRDTLVRPMETPDILGKFSHEPTIRQIQNVAIRYAEVHPDKIKAWREQASRKAFLPSLSLNAQHDKNQNVDLDRGGTNDPDTFIIGPAEKSFDWSVGVSWDLGDLIWNDDQTSIDTRSRLMVELRDDVLNEVTHLYYERRRLQVEMLMLPPKELPLQVEKQLKLEELTAGIDGLTGGFLSRALETT